MNETIINKDFDMLEQVVAEFDELYIFLRNTQDMHLVGKKNIPEIISDYEILKDNFNVTLNLMHYQSTDWNQYIKQRRAQK